MVGDPWDILSQFKDESLTVVLVTGWWLMRLVSEQWNHFLTPVITFKVRSIHDIHGSTPVAWCWDWW